MSSLDLDITEKIELIEKSTAEVVTREELVTLLETNDSPKHYIGLEISGFLHLGSLFSTGFKINDFVKAGVRCTIFLADWHTMINDKLGGDWDAISAVSKYYYDAFKIISPDADIVLGSKLYEKRPEYWAELLRFTKRMSLARTKKTLTIMGRTESDSIELAKLIYPPMQAVDIHMLDVDIAHAGMDQRKIHMLVRDVFPKMGWKKPVAIHHGLLPGLGVPAAHTDSQITKMSKTDKNSGIFIHDTDKEVTKKINKAWCEERNVQNNPLLEIAKTIIFHENKEVQVQRPTKYGGNISYYTYNQMKEDFEKGDLHPGDLKHTVGQYLVQIMRPLREKMTMSPEMYNMISKGY